MTTTDDRLPISRAEAEERVRDLAEVGLEPGVPAVPAKPVASCGRCQTIHDLADACPVQQPTRDTASERMLANLIRRPTLAHRVAEVLPPVLLTELADAVEAEVTHRVRMAREADAAAVEQVVSEHVNRWESLRAERWGSGVSRG